MTGNMSWRHDRRLITTICACLVFAVCVFPVAAMISDGDSFTLQQTDDVGIAWAFEFAAGGNLTMTVSLQITHALPRNVQLILMTDTEAAPLSLTTRDALCVPPVYNATNTTWQAALNQFMQNAVTSVSPTKADWLKLYILKCDASAPYQLSGSVSYVAVNPGGEFLSLSQVPYKVLYPALMIMWVVLALVWVSTWFGYYRAGFNTALQRVMTLALITKAMLCVPWSFYWYDASITGHYPEDITIYRVVCECVDQATLFMVATLMAKGYGITVDSLTRNEQRECIVYVFALTLSYCCLIFLDQYAVYFLLLLMIMTYIMAFRYIFAAVMLNTMDMINQLHIISNHTQAATFIDINKTPLWAKLHMFKLLQVVLVCYVSIDVVFQLWTFLFLRDSMPWLSDGSEHIMCALAAMAAGYAFAMRPFNPYYYHIMRLYAHLTPDAQTQQRRRDQPPSQRRPQQPPNERAADDDNGSYQPPRSPPANGTDANRGEPATSVLSRLRRFTMSGSSRTDAAVWRPGQSVPATTLWSSEEPAEPIHSAEIDANILVIESPYETDADGRGLPTVYLAQSEGTNPARTLPSDVVRYFPSAIVELLDVTEAEAADDEQRANRQARSDIAMTNIN